MSKKHLLVAALVTVMAVWVFSGELSNSGITADESASPSPVEQGNAATPKGDVKLVRAVKSTADNHRVYLDVRGQTRANRVVQVKSEISGKIVQLPGEKGKAVGKGDLLCRIAVDARQDEYKEVLAELRSAQLEYDGFKDLNKKGLQSEILMAKAKAALEESRTLAKRAQLALEKTAMVAPFEGIVERQFVEEGDYLTPGDTCVSLMEVDPILVVGQVAEKDIARISLHDEVEVRLITGEVYQGLASYIGHAPDMTTRTFPVEVTVDNPGAAIRAGLTAEMRVLVGSELAHLISPASLVLNDLGVVGVHVVDESNRVRFLPVDVVDEGPSGVMVRGLPPEISLITVGQEEVFEGQLVEMDYTPVSSLAGL